MAHEPIPETNDAQEARRRTVARLQAANGHAPAARRLNGANGHALAAPPPEQANWAQLIAQQELRYERQIGALREQVAELTELFAKSAGDEPLTTADLPELAKGIAPFVSEVVKDAVAPLSKRLDEIESVVRTLVQSAARHE